MAKRITFCRRTRRFDYVSLNCDAVRKTTTRRSSIKINNTLLGWVISFVFRKKSAITWLPTQQFCTAFVPNLEYFSNFSQQVSARNMYNNFKRTTLKKYAYMQSIQRNNSTLHTSSTTLNEIIEEMKIRNLIGSENSLLKSRVFGETTSQFLPDSLPSCHYRHLPTN